MSTRTVVMSDVHGNLPALRAVVSSLPEHGNLVVAGDLCLDGPEPAATLDLLRELTPLLLMGNTDRDIVSPSGLKPKKARMVEWARHQLGEERLGFLAGLPFSIALDGENVPALLAVHANPLNMDDQLYPTMSEADLRPYLEHVEASILAFGHLHIPYTRPVDGVLLVDVSSVGHPKDRDRRAAFTLIEGIGDTRSVTQVRVPYDVEETVHRMRASGMPDAEAEIASLLKASY